MPQQFEHVRRHDTLPPNDQQVVDPHRGVHIPDGNHMNTLFAEAGIDLKETTSEVGSLVVRDQTKRTTPDYDWPSADYDPSDPHHHGQFDWLATKNQ